MKRAGKVVKKRYRILLPIEIGERIYTVGETVEMGMDEAVKYSHALIASEEKKEEETNDGGDS